MPRLIWSQPALREVQRLYRFLSSQNPLAAQRAAKAICQGVTVLEQQLGVGRQTEDMPDEFREWIINFGDNGYLARYRIDSHVGAILAMRHQKAVG